MQDTTILFEGVSIQYGAFTAVSSLSFEVKRGEIFGLLGPNGAGKTTSFLSLTRQVKPSSGKISLLGQDVAYETLTLHLERPEERQRLADLLTSEIPVTLHTREFNFHQAFLSITGEEYN